MDKGRLRKMFEGIRNHSIEIDSAISELADLPFSELGYAVVDHHRALRQGVPEVILGQGKTAEQIAGIAAELVRTGQNVLITRINAEKAGYHAERLEPVQYVQIARVATIEVTAPSVIDGFAVALVCAGTSDIPVAEECAETLRMFGVSFERVFDVGALGFIGCWHTGNCSNGCRWRLSWRGWKARCPAS